VVFRGLELAGERQMRLPLRCELSAVFWSISPYDRTTFDTSVVNHGDTNLEQADSGH
jgi:hypothetical protein